MQTTAPEPQPIWPTLRPQLERYSPHFPAEALALALDHREEVAPHLLGVLAQLAADPTMMADEDDWALHMWAMHLLAAWRDTRAYAPLVALAHHDEDTLEMLLGDVVTESLPACLASVCDGNTAPLRALFEDSAACFWSRLAALEALKIRVLEGDDDRQTLIDYLMIQGLAHATRLRAPDVVSERDEEIDAIVNVAADIGAIELRPHIESWYADGLLDPQIVDSPDWTLARLAEPLATHQARMLERGRGYVRNVRLAIGWMWREDPAPAWVPPVTLVRTEPKVGRNDPCTCGSGKKYKKCCGA